MPTSNSAGLSGKELTTTIRNSKVDQALMEVTIQLQQANAAQDLLMPQTQLLAHQSNAIHLLPNQLAK